LVDFDRKRDMRNKLDVLLKMMMKMMVPVA
jgi:hypothetical protein